MNEIVVGFKRDCSPFKLIIKSVSSKVNSDDFSHIATTTRR